MYLSRDYSSIGPKFEGSSGPVSPSSTESAPNALSRLGHTFGLRQLNFVCVRAFVRLCLVLGFRVYGSIFRMGVGGVDDDVEDPR